MSTETVHPDPLGDWFRKIGTGLSDEDYEAGIRAIAQAEENWFATALNAMQDEVYSVNQANGWHDEDREVLSGHMLIVSEVAEATEAYRDWGMADMTGVEELHKALLDPVTGEKVAKPLGIGSEYADVLIRTLDDTKRHGIDLMAEYTRKIRYNRLRGYKHGGKLA